jgi:hypothetical protein
METMDKDQFSKFIAEQITSMNIYSFDLFYDIRKIMNELFLYQAESNNPIKGTYHLMIRASGSDLIKPDDPNYKTYIRRNDKIYELTFCWNEAYFSKECFCTVNEIHA